LAFNVVYYKEADGTVPVFDWIISLPTKVQEKFRFRITRLSDLGHELRRPEADFLINGIYELQVSHLHIQYRILYFFHGRNIVVLCHGLKKTDVVPLKEIEKAIERKNNFELNPEKHTAGDPE
jgi:phage-related protein